MKYKTILSFVMTLMCALPASAKTFTVEIETIDDVRRRTEKKLGLSDQETP